MVVQLDKLGNVVGKYKSAGQAARETGLDSSHILKVLKGKRSRHGGFYWRYDNEPVSEFDESRSFEYKSDSAVLTAKTEKSITSEEEAIDFFEVDMERWQVDKFLVNSWDVSMKDKKGGSFKRTNYQVKLWLEKRKRTVDDIVKDLTVLLDERPAKDINFKSGNFRTITVELSDFHIGADIKDLVRTPDFNIGIITKYLNQISNMVNSFGSENVVVNMHGDFVESITGLNHQDSWKSIGDGLYGAGVLIMANELISRHLLSKILNLRQVNMVAGNHDRISASRTIDGKGEGAALLAWSFQKDFPDLQVNYDPLILVKEIDGIVHIMTHGHHGISKRDVAKVVADYGDSTKFNLWTEGHLHSRNYRKVLKSKIASYDTIDYVAMDEQKYRKLVLPPVFTGNFFSESIGYSGWSGFVITYNNGRGVPNFNDYTI